jgi:hypothetical protein
VGPIRTPFGEGHPERGEPRPQQTDAVADPVSHQSACGAESTQGPDQFGHQNDQKDHSDQDQHQARQVRHGITV